MTTATPKTLLEVLASLPDPRGRQGRDYPLAALLALTVAALLSGRRSLRGVARFARDRPDLLEPLGFLPTQPVRLHYTTLARALEKLDLDALNLALHSWRPAFGDGQGAEPRLRALAVDGKTLRGSAGSKGEAAVQLLEAHLVEAAESLGAVPVEGGEASTLPRLLESLGLASLEGLVVLGDAGLLTFGVAGAVTQRGGITC